MKKSIVYLGVALLAFGNVAIASNLENNPVAKVYVANETLSPLCNAVVQGDFETVKKMIEFGSDINETSNGLTPLMIAARYNRVEIVQLLVKNGAKINQKDAKGKTALKHAELSNAKETVEFLKAYKK